MTGEMIKPQNAEKGEQFWEGKIGQWGTRVLGDEAYLIRPTYPQFFNLADKLKKMKMKASVEPFDVYQGPYIEIEGRAGMGKLWQNEKGWTLQTGMGWSSDPKLVELGNKDVPVKVRNILQTPLLKMPKVRM
jgi:hypothetical protein